MRKKPSEIAVEESGCIIGLGPGFKIGRDAHAIVETKRGHHLGRVIKDGTAAADTGEPEPVRGYALSRILRAPANGVLQDGMKLGTMIKQGETIATISGSTLRAPFRGALRGLLHDGIDVEQGMKIGDLDPRGVLEYCHEVSDKALSVGGGVLEALLTQSSIRRKLAA